MLWEVQVCYGRTGCAVLIYWRLVEVVTLTRGYFSDKFLSYELLAKDKLLDKFNDSWAIYQLLVFSGAISANGR